MTMLKRLSILLVILTLITTAAQAYYDPYTGRFLQRDPAGDGGNWYAYAANNPMKYTDPTGMVIKLVDGNHSVSITSASDIPTQLAGAVGQSSKLDWLIDIFAKSGDNAALSSSGILNDTLKTVIESSIVTTLQFDTLQANLPGASGVAVAETLPTTLEDSVQSIRINLPLSSLTQTDYTTLPSLRTGVVHELSHASNIINEPALANTDDYVNRLTLEFRAYDLDAKWGNSITGHHSGFYLPDSRLQSVVNSHGIGSYAYNSVRFILAKAAALSVP